MADERGDMTIYDDCADDLSDISIYIVVLEKDIASPKNESKAESLEDSEILRRIWRMIQLATDSDESDEDDRCI